VLVDLDAAAIVLREVLAAAQSATGGRLRHVVAGVGGGQVRSMRASGSFRTKVPVVLHAPHLDRALDAAADIGLPAEHEVLHVLPSSWQVDGVRVGRTPLGMRSRHLGVDATVVTVRSAVLDALQRVLERLGYELVGAAAEPLAAGRVALGSEDRQRGAVLIDVGAEAAAAVAYRDGAVQSLAWLQAGGAHVTRDIAFALQLEIEHAETLKRRAAVALVESADPQRQIDVRRGRETLRVSQQTLASIVEARMEELFGMARDALRSQAALGLGDRVVLSGGGARLVGAVLLAEQVFESPARLAAPAACYGWQEAAGDPACCTALGLVDYAERSGLLRGAPTPVWTRAWDGLRRAMHGRTGPRSAGAADRALDGETVHA
jgi:cell division protein FtsA